jgi:hypothetical protein
MRTVCRITLVAVLAANAGCLAFEAPEMLWDELGPTTMARLGRGIPDPEQPLVERIVFGTKRISLKEQMDRETDWGKLVREKQTDLPSDSPTDKLAPATD